MRRAALVVALALLVGACSSDDASPAGPPTTATGRLAAARERWEAAGIDDYTWTFTRYCFCPPLTVRVQVRDGLAREQTVVEGPQVETSFDFLTMEALYDEIAEEIDVSEVVEAEYDPDTGAVIRVRFDRDANGFDDELEYRVTGFMSGADLDPRLEDVELTESFPCGHALQASNRAQTVGVELTFDSGGPVPTDVDLPDPHWAAVLLRGQDLFANWCNDIVTPDTPERVVEHSLPIVGGHLSLTGPTEGDRTVTADITDLVVRRLDGTLVELPDTTITNENWGGAAG